MKVIVNLNSVGVVKNFVEVISRYPFSADLSSGRYVVDARSIMGIFSLDIAKPVTLTIHSEEDCVDDFLTEIDGYIVK